MPSPAFLQSFRRLRTDRRGISAVVFAVTAVPVFGAMALATDAGLWYSARKGAGNAADVAALTGAAVLPRAGATLARTAALDVSSRNGFADGGANTVLVNIPPTSGPNAGNAAAVEVIVRQQQQLAASGLFLRSAPVVAGRSVAVVQDSRPVCMLALSSGFTMQGSSGINAPDCTLASNRQSGPSFELGSNVAVTAFSASAVTTCEGCTGSEIRLTRSAAEGQLPARNPFQALDAKVLPTFNAGHCINAPNNPTTLQPYETNGGRAYCNSDIRVAAGVTLTLTPGTYYLQNAGLRVTGGATVTCPTCTDGAGVTFVLTGDANRVGEIDINAGSLVGLHAPSSPADPDYRGILFYRDIRANTGGTGVKITATGQFDVRGGMYFPSSAVEFAGISSTTGCMVLVADAIDVRGMSAAGVQGCAASGTSLAYTQVARIIE